MSTLTLAPRDAAFVDLTIASAGDPEVRQMLPELARAQEEATRKSLRWLAGNWGTHGEVVELLMLRVLANESLGERDHGDGFICDGPHLVCWWEFYRGALEAVGEYDTEENQEVLAEAERVLISGLPGVAAGIRGE